MTDNNSTHALFDSHCHLQNNRFHEDRQNALQRAREAGVTRILNLATRLADAAEVVQLAADHPECLAAVGVHPSDLDDWGPETEAGLRDLAQHPRVVVWGEIGIDYFHKDFDTGTQRRIFRRQLAIARELGLPVAIHCRDAYDDMIADLRAENGPGIGGVAHCFAGNDDQAQALLEMGFFLGVGGIATFPKNEELRGTLRRAGIDNLLLETDSPYLAPQARRGKRNEPAFVAFTAQSLAETMEVEEAHLRRVVWENTRRAFRLNENATGRAG